ncbi:MAG: hypothetical protein M3P18_20400 [Actinomycetota bacterium]|nr:hypothetical protein [Actinomycetota bacterium]
MFIQVLRGRAIDPDGLIGQLDGWLKELSPGAGGWLGNTAGITSEGRFIASFRFESMESARKNSDRSEQTQWWNETSRYMDTPRFWDCDLVDEYKQGGSDQAGFVQVIQGRVLDRDAYRQAGLSLGGAPRADVIGGVVAWDGSRFTEVVYFTSEEEARKGEQSPPHTGALEKVWALTQDLDYFDLRDPWLASPETT